MLMRSVPRRNDFRRLPGVLPFTVAVLLLQPEPVTWLERTTVLMGTTLTARIAAPDAGQAASALEAAFRSVRGVEDILSSWRTDTELGRANRAPVGVPVALSPRLGGWLALVEDARAMTGGAFDPAVGALVDVWDLRGVGRRPEPGRLATARAAVGPAGVAIDTVAGTLTRLHPAAWLDAGGFGKGVALAQARTVLAGAGVRAGLLNFGGQVLAMGSGPDGGPWVVPVADPQERGRPVMALAVRDRSVATSAQSQRFVTVDGRRYGQVLDPRTGRPVPAWGSVTVVHADPAAADMLATALLVLGPVDGLVWARARKIAALFLVTDGSEPAVRCTAALAIYLEDDRRCR